MTDKVINDKPKKPISERKTLLIPVELINRMKKLAIESNRSLNGQVVHTLKLYIENLDKEG